MMFSAIGLMTNAQNPPLAFLFFGVAFIILVLGFVQYWRNREKE
jgi:hypothetical protein